MKRALVVEDDPDIVELVSHYLSKDGWRPAGVARRTRRAFRLG
jgi:DNA-binding response OmpR family regulator